jgi:hypothetical protein
MKRILILGGGASGLAAAIAAAQNAPDAQVTLLDANPRPGKKLLATGNGRCNLDNLHSGDAERYFTADKAALRGMLAAIDAIETCGASGLAGWWGALGLYTRADEAGRIYPYSNQAADVVELLLDRLAALGVETRTGCRFETLAPHKGGYRVAFRDEGGEPAQRMADAVICALGGKAGPQFGTGGFGPAFAAQCGGRCEPLYPCLVPLNCTPLRGDKKQLEALAGIRAKATAALYDGDALVAQESGEIQFTSYGLSGIAVMQLSGWLVPGRGPRALQNPALELDLFPQLEPQALAALLAERAQRGLCGSAAAEATPEAARRYFVGLLHPALGQAVWQAAGLGGISPAAPEAAPRLAHALKHWRFTALSPCDWKAAQTTGGGLSLREVEPNSFQLNGCPGVYFVGETLDCAGSCGGFNLHWAFGSGLVAGTHAARYVGLSARPAQREGKAGPAPKRKKAR